MVRIHVIYVDETTNPKNPNPPLERMHAHVRHSPSREISRERGRRKDGSVTRGSPLLDASEAMSDEAFLEAIKAGDLQEIKRLRLECWTNGVNPDAWWDAWTCRAAAEGDQLECLKYLHENGCPWDEWACTHAALWCHLECLKYLHENGCPLNIDHILNEGSQDIDENGCPWEDIEAYLKACMGSPNKCPYQTAMAALDEVKTGMPDSNYKTIADALMLAHRAKGWRR